MILLGAVLSLPVAAAAVRLRLLTRGGGAAAVLIGAVVLGFGGWVHAALLVTFFVSSSLLTTWQRDRKDHPEHRTGRTAPQVLANGTVAAILAAMWSQFPLPAVAAAFSAALAAATADTWATEVGLLSRQPPRLITTWQEVHPGASGGVTWLGSVSALIGAGVVAAGALWGLGVPLWIPWLTGTMAMLLDSALGATVEGRRAMTNDTVNLLATLAAAAAGAVLSLVG